MCQPGGKNKDSQIAWQTETTNVANREDWDFDLENIKIQEDVEWLHNDHSEIPQDTLLQWLKESTPKTDIQDEDHFCDRTALNAVIDAKNIFKELDAKDLYRARAKANPFETIHSMFFMNRAALKMANIDAACDFMFTNIDRDMFHKHNTGPYYFADVCAGPGGFSEYVLWRKKWLFKGFGFTLREKHDFRLTDSVCASDVTFQPFYGAKGDGDVRCPENIKNFSEKVLHETEKRGVHFMMSDGGFSVEGIENMQEILSKDIYICQCLVALEILREHGHFVTKFFDIFTSFSVGLVYLLYHCFERICVVKPNSSRPANSERYIVCYNFNGREKVNHVLKYFRIIVNRLWELQNNEDLDISEIVNLDVMKNDHNFYSYIYRSNNRIAEYQTVHLKKLAAFCRNPVLKDDRQDRFRTQCLNYWQIPDKPHIALSRFCVEDLLLETVANRDLLVMQPRELKELDNIALEQWQFVFLQCNKYKNICNFYAGVGSSKVYRFQCNKWVRVKNVKLIRGTLLYGEMVKEKYILSDDSVNEKYSLHVIDALRLGDVQLGDLNFNERMSLIQTYCNAVNHEFRKDVIRIRAKICNKLQTPCDLKKDENCKNNVLDLPILGYDAKHEFYEVHSALLLKADESESFHSTYVLRLQLFMDFAENERYLKILTSFLNK